MQIDHDKNIRRRAAGNIPIDTASEIEQINLDGFVNSPISALRFSALSLRRSGSTPHSTRLFAFANVTLPARACFCLFGRWPKIQATRAAGGR
jgi:hypothetical protein